MERLKPIPQQVGSAGRTLRASTRTSAPPGHDCPGVTLKGSDSVGVLESSQQSVGQRGWRGLGGWEKGPKVSREDHLAWALVDREI